MFPRMLESQTTGSLWHQGIQLKDICKPIHNTLCSRGHHKWIYCEPYSAQAGAFTGSPLQEHLTAQGMAHSVASSWRTCWVYYPRSFSIFFCLPTISRSQQWRFSSRCWKSCPSSLKFVSHFFEELVTFYVYLNRYEGYWKKFTLFQFFHFSNLQVKWY